MKETCKVYADVYVFNQIIRVLSSGYFLTICGDPDFSFQAWLRVRCSLKRSVNCGAEHLQPLHPAIVYGPVDPNTVSAGGANVMASLRLYGQQSVVFDPKKASSFEELSGSLG